MSLVELCTAFLTLTILEIVLGIDNIVFLAILVSKLPKELQARGRFIGLCLAMVARICLLFTLSYLALLTKPFLYTFSGRDLVLLAGGLFLIWKATVEIHEKVEGDGSKHSKIETRESFSSVIVQIVLIDLVFSLDSVITAVGIVNYIPVMVAAIVASIMLMMLFAGTISAYIDKYPTFKMLALSFLILVGLLLVAEAFGKHIERGYVYFAMAFSFIVEFLNTRASRKTKGH